MTTLKGMIFDLDGTLVDSRLDFDLMRKEIGIPQGHPVLEYVGALVDGEHKARCGSILLEHEFRGAREATVIEGVPGLLARLGELNLKQAILTRNTGGPTRLVLERLSLRGFSPVLTREDAPPKPDPAGLLRICQSWGCEPGQVIFVGDYRFDLDAGKRAGMKTVLYAAGERPEFADEADHVMTCYHEFTAQFDQIVREGLGFQY